VRFVCLASNWAFGIIFLLAGLHLSKGFLLGGLSLVLISLLLLPPVRSLVYWKTRKELSPRIRAAAILSLVIASGGSVVGSQIREDQKLSAMEAHERIQRKHAQSQKRHVDFFWDESWDHSDYVEGRGASLCEFCHGVEAADPSLFGPRCMSCHRDIEAFERSIQPRRQRTSLPY